VADDDPIVREIFIEASPEVVFGYFTDAEKYTRWLGLRAELDVRPGGLFRVDPNGREMIRGTYLEVVPYSRIVFTWGFEEPGHPVPAGSSVVEVTLAPQRNGTLVRLIHRGLPKDSRGGHDQGWVFHLGRLALAALGQDLGPSGCPGAEVEP
jgi:uncharacterized protein YndB with AHSA1/START domain